MLKSLHFIFILGSLISFIARIILQSVKPEILQLKLMKVVPHVLDTLLLFSGIALVVQGNWLDREYGWILSKLITLLGYIIFGVICMRSTGIKRWLALAGALGCFASIFVIAISKQGFFY